MLATPKLLAIDGKPAEIIIGVRLGYYLVTTTETSTLQSVEFLNIGTQLQLTPHISREGKILLNIHPEVSDGSIDALGLPSTRTTEVTTSLMAEDGDTIFIGGLIRKRKEKVKRMVPFVGCIPLLGTFFGRTEDREDKTEIVILITPHIITPDTADVYAGKIEMVENAEASHQEKDNTAKKLFISDRMFDKISMPDKHGRTGSTQTDQLFPVPTDNNTRTEQPEAPTPAQAGYTSGPDEPVTSYSLLVSSYYELQNARIMQAKLLEKGYPAYLLTSQDQKGQTVTAVKVGPLDDYETILSFTRKIHTDTGVRPLIFSKP